MEQRFEEQLKQTGYIHKPLPITGEGLWEEMLLERKVLSEKKLYSFDTEAVFECQGMGEVNEERKEAEKERLLKISGKSVTFCWPEGMDPDGDLSYYGEIKAKLNLNREDWTGYHAMVLMIKPDCIGQEQAELQICIRNEGKCQIPDEYEREGFHSLNLINGQWNRCIWEFGALPRDAVTGVYFVIRQNGKETLLPDELQYFIKEVSLIETESPYQDHGWMCPQGTIACPGNGYFQEGRKTAVTSMTKGSFSLMDAENKTTVFTGEITPVSFRDKCYGILDFSEFREEGCYYLETEEARSFTFEISNQIYGETIWKIINFFFTERCGYPIPGHHGRCHCDIYAKYGNYKVPFYGGWHDAGDMSQQMLHTAESADALLQMADCVKKEKGASSLLYQRLIEEARWGLEFVLQSRIEEGHRATSAGVTRWTDGWIGNKDDIFAREHAHAFENLLCSYLEIRVAEVLKEEEAGLSKRLQEAAEEDYRYGIERFEQYGRELPLMWEHSYNSSQSLYYAVITAVSSMLYLKTGQEGYREDLQKYGTALVECQETNGTCGGFNGYFYRDESKSHIVHFNHQSREYLFAEALVLADKADGKETDRWKNSLILHAGYLERLMEEASPYGMFPAGLYQEQEAEDKETFELLHLLVNHSEQKPHYKKQLESSKSIGEGYYVRQFPVWFSFRGNNAILLSFAKAAAIAGKYLGKELLTQAAREQIYWMEGKNPFGQSMIYGDGACYPSMYAVFPGEMVGEMPVGIATRDDEDEPYWPGAHNATYKEVWTSVAVRFLWTLAEL